MPETRPLGVLLAAGTGRRFGADKLLTPLPQTDEPVGIAAARKLLEAVPDTLAVVREAEGALARRLRRLGMRVVGNPRAEAGMGTSIACAVRHSRTADAWLIALADMPWIEVSTHRQVAAALRAGAEIAVPDYGGRRGHPVGFSGIFRAELEAFAADQGARKLLATHHARVTRIPVADAGILRDVDSPSDLLTDPRTRGFR